MPYIDAFREYAIVSLIIIVVLTIFIYVMVARFLNKMNKVMYGKGTPMAWIPFTQNYLIGKLAINKLVGWVIVLGGIIPNITWTQSECEYGFCLTVSKRIVPENIANIINLIVAVTVLALYIYDHFKYKKLLKNIDTSIVINSENTSQDINDNFYGNNNKFINNQLASNVESNMLEKESIVTNNNLNSTVTVPNSLNQVKEEKKETLTLTQSLEGFVPVTEDEIIKNTSSQINIEEKVNNINLANNQDNIDNNDNEIKSENKFIYNLDNSVNNIDTNVNTNSSNVNLQPGLNVESNNEIQDNSINNKTDVNNNLNNNQSSLFEPNIIDNDSSTIEKL